MTGEFDTTHVKILVHTPPVDGYPPEEWESLWATPLEKGCFKIDNIPFFAKNLSCGDVVEASLEGDKYIFKRIVDPSEYSTIRVVLYDLMYENSLRERLAEMSCSIEGSGTPGLIAINIPKDNLENVIDALEEAFADNKLDFEEGALR